VLEVGSKTYQAGLRTTPEQPIVYISSDLLTADREKISLSRVLRLNGWRRNDLVLLRFNDGPITIHSVPNDT
jgi:hypothetical protein